MTAQRARAGLDVVERLLVGQADRDRLPDVELDTAHGVDEVGEPLEVDHRPVVHPQAGDALDTHDRRVDTGVLRALEELGVVECPCGDGVEVHPLDVEAAGELLVEHRALGEGEVLHVARERDQHRLAGLGVDAGDRHRVRAQAPPAGAGVTSEQQHVVATVVRADRRAVAEHRDHEGALHPDDVGTEEQGAGDAEAEEAVDPDDREAVLALEGERLAEAPRVDEEVGPADRETHHPQPQHLQEGRVGAGPECDTVPEVGRRHRQHGKDDEPQPDPQRGEAQATPARDELGRAREHQRHQHQRHGAAEADALGAVERGEPLRLRPGGRSGWHVVVSLCWGKSATPVSPVPPVTSGHDAPTRGYSSRPSSISALRANRCARRISASRWRRTSLGVSVSSGGTRRDLPSSSIATKTK